MRDKVHYPHHVEKYGPVEWVKFGIPVCFASVAMGCCLLLLCTCKFSVKVQDVGQFGYVSYVDGNSTDNVCRPYSAESASLLYVDMDQQFRMAQVSAFMVIPMGFVLIMTLLLAPFSRLMNGVWSRLLSVAGALVIGNLQLLSVVKFIRYFLRAYDGIHVRYESRFVVYGSVIFWLATAISVSICGVKQKVQYANREPAVDEDNSPPWKVAEHDEDLNVTIEHDDEHDELEIVKSFSGGTRDTGDLEDGIAKSFESP
ncbi:hypothetical protein IV203_037932 [Nitzschia inconspicua]|uniref:Transmembrane protein n=1 Tax=Nitzschia inconspicua TaxID=303405 RepID=A0A9K3LLN0_9STRA|nr:hypothetical protein IV203_037932 [Nitzschia inconspicua]